MLDAGSLNVLGAYFERLMGRIQDRVDQVSVCVCVCVVDIWDGESWEMRSWKGGRVVQA